MYARLEERNVRSLRRTSIKNSSLEFPPLFSHNTHMFQKVALHAREHLSNPKAFLDILAQVQKWSKEVHLTPEAMQYVSEHFSKVDFEKKYDIFIVFGGDGSVLNVAGRMKNFETPVLGISAGTLGFLAEIAPSDFPEAYQRIMRGERTIDSRCMLDICISRASGKKEYYHALNDAVISQSDVVRLARIETSVNHEYLTTYRADALIVSTPTGSTAYSLSAGGPIMYPHFRALILTPVAPHSLSHRSLVLPKEKRVQVSADTKSRTSLLLTIDGQRALSLHNDDVVDIGVHPHAFSFVRLPEEHFFKTISRKMHWGKECDTEG